MSDNKKYYYFRLTEDFFDKDNMKVIESQPNGYIYSNILLKLYLRSLKGNGRLMMTDRIPYDPNNIDTLAKVIGHDLDHVKQALKIACELDKMTILDSGEMWMNDIQNYIGRSSTEADRKRKYRILIDSKIEKINKDKLGTNVLKPQDKSTLEIKKDIDIKKEKEKNIYIDLLTHWNNKNIIVHKKEIFEKNIKKKHKDIIKLYGEDVIKQAIDNYSIVLESDRYYWSYRWGFLDFISKGIEKFKDEAKPLDNFLKQGYVKKSTPESSKNKYAGFEE